MQAQVPLAGSILCPFRSYPQVQDQIKMNKCILILEKSDSKECKTNLKYRKGEKK